MLLPWRGTYCVVVDMAWNIMCCCHGVERNVLLLWRGTYCVVVDMTSNV